MESEREKYVEASKSFVPSVEIAFGHREGVAEVESAVHVGVGEGLEELGLSVGFCSEKLISLPYVSGPLFEGNELISSGGVLHMRIN